MSSAENSSTAALHMHAADSFSSMAGSTIASASSTTAPVSSVLTAAAVGVTSAAISQPAPQQVTAIQSSPVVQLASSSFVAGVPGAYSLFQSLPPVLPWQSPVIHDVPGLYSTSMSTPMPQPHSSPRYFGFTFSGAPGLSRPADNSLFQSPMATIAQSIYLISNVTQIITIKLKAVEDYITWRTQFESFLVSQGLFSFLDGFTPVPPMYLIDFNNRQIINTDYYHWLRVYQTIC
ncbi:unnamed protein product [Cuscuta epithymum]|uniref:Retrotransposon Copia-like N-terminal domain-containing protein n=1 Tax=Cuscuta epithymum TaxID=186058 RepID=A0AAV0FC67_9ASTE|nr:unnamed protein product [Cuscuta epithymum]